MSFKNNIITSADFAVTPFSHDVRRNVVVAILHAISGNIQKSDQPIVSLFGVVPTEVLILAQKKYKCCQRLLNNLKHQTECSLVFRLWASKFPTNLKILRSQEKGQQSLPSIPGPDLSWLEMNTTT